MPAVVYDGPARPLPAGVLSTAPSSTDVGLVVRPIDENGSGQVLAQQAGAGAVLDFTFASAVQLVCIEANGTGVARADPYGGTPTSSLGIPCRDQVPLFLPVVTTAVKVFAPVGVTVNVWGYRR